MSDLNPPTIPLKTPHSPTPVPPPTPQDVKRRLSVLAPRVDTNGTTAASGSTSSTGQSRFAPASPSMPTSPGVNLNPSIGSVNSSSTPNAAPGRGKNSFSQAQASSSALSSSGMSSTSEDEADPSSSTTAQAQARNNQNNAQVPLSAISEADSGTDSDASSDVAGERSHRRARGIGVPADQVTKAMERLRISRESSRLAESVALKGGYLMKKGERRKAWKRRWFVLRGGRLAMYKNEKEYRLLRLIPLADIHTCSPIELKKHAHSFGIVTPKRTYYVKADSEREVREWCQAVQQAKRDLTASTTVTSLPDGGSGDITPLGKGARSPGVGKLVPNLPNISTSTTATEQRGSFISSPELQPMHNFPSSPMAVGGPINGTEAGSGLSSSYTSTSSGGGSGGAASLGIPGASGSTNRSGSTAPPNSFAPGAEGALGLRGADGHTLELNAVDARLARQGSQQRSSSIVSDRSTGRDSYLSVNVAGASVTGGGGGGGDYFGGGSGTLSRTSMSLNPPLSPGGGGGVSSSEDEDGFDTYDASWIGTSTAPPASPGPTGGGTSRQLTFAEQAPTTPLRSPVAPTTNAPSTPGTGGFTDPNKIILSGYLMKQGKRKTWRKRWFVLMSTRLMYSRSHMEGKINRQIPLSKILDAIEFEGTNKTGGGGVMGSIPGTPLLGNGTSSSTAGGSGGGGVGGSNTMPGSDGRVNGTGSTFDHCFKIITPKRTFLVCAPSEEDEIKWLAALQCLVQRKNGTNGAVVGGLATTIGGSGAGTGAGAGVGAGVGAGASIGQTTSTSSASLVAQAPPVTRRPSALGIGRKRSITDAAKEAVDEVERRYHPTSQVA